MNKTEIIKEFKERADLANLKDSKEILNIVGQMILDHMKDEDGFAPFSGIKFGTTYVETHAGRNPATGDTITIPGKYRPTCKFGKAVKDALN